MKRFGNIILNVVLVGTCVVTIADTILRYFRGGQVEAARKNTPTSLAGSAFKLTGEEWGKNRYGTLVFGVSTHCHFCTESGPFFREIVKSVGTNIATIALAPEPPDQVRQYLASLNLEIYNIRQIRLVDLGIRGTPTVLFVNQHGIVERMWRGALTPDKEKEILAYASSVVAR
jgi:hypothetical protein